MTTIRNNASLAKYTIIFSILFIFVSICSVVIIFQAYLAASHTPGMLERICNRKEALDLTHPNETVNTIWLLIAGIQSILFLVWLFRVYKNVRLLFGTTHYTLIWTIISWVIPVVNWIIPFNLFKEIYNKLNLVTGSSHPEQSYNSVVETNRIIAIVISLGSWIVFFINDLPLQISFIRAIAEYSLMSVTGLCSMPIIKRINALEQKALLTSQHPEDSIFRTGVQK